MVNSLLYDLVETCTITRKTSSGSDELGQPTFTTSSSTSICRFDFTSVSGAGGGYAAGPDVSGRFLVGAPYVFLPAGTNVRIGDTITSTVSEFTGPYEVIYLKNVTGLFSTAVDHIEAYLQKTEKGAV